LKNLSDPHIKILATDLGRTSLRWAQRSTRPRTPLRADVGRQGSGRCLRREANGISRYIRNGHARGWVPAGLLAPAIRV